jgi:glucose-6-phosphate dehydrogenase assembly protein OpcA
MIELTDTSSAAIAAEFVRARRRSGSPAMGMIMTVVVVADDDESETAMSVARAASQEHPARILGVVLGDRRGAPQVDAKIAIGSGASGERAVITLTGEVVKHAQSVVLPLLLPDSPVVVWWPGRAPADPAADPLGMLGTRRITDAASAPTAKSKAMLHQCASYAPGNTDLAWTRITGWRALLAAALDQFPGKVLSASVTAERISPSADLLSAWLGDRLRCEVTRSSSAGPGITAVVLSTGHGDVAITRPDGRLATLSTPGQPDRPVALKRRDLDELLNEELRRLDPDDVYAATVGRLLEIQGRPGAKRTATGKRSSARSRTSTATKPRASKRASTAKKA